MADIPGDSFIRVTFATSIANKAAPTVAELNAGILLQSTATSTGLTGWMPDTASIANRKLDSTFNSSDVGSISIEDPVMRFFKQDGTDTIYITMAKGTAGFIAIRRSIAAGTAWAATQALVGVYPVKCGQRRWLDVEENTMERWEMPFKVTAEPAFDAVVAA